MIQPRGSRPASILNCWRRRYPHINQTTGRVLARDGRGGGDGRGGDGGGGARRAPGAAAGEAPLPSPVPVYIPVQSAV